MCLTIYQASWNISNDKVMEMKEFTVTLNAQITMIHKDGDEETIVRFDEEKKKRLERFIKEHLLVDDVVVSDYKVFMMGDI